MAPCMSSDALLVVLVLLLVLLLVVLFPLSLSVNRGMEEEEEEEETNMDEPDVTNKYVSNSCASWSSSRPAS